MADRLIKEFAGYNGLRTSDLIDKDSKRVTGQATYINLLYMGGKFNVTVSPVFTIDHSSGVSVLKHIPSGNIFPPEKPLVAVLEGVIQSVIAFKQSKDVFMPKTLVNVQLLNEDTHKQPSLKMEVKK